MTDVTLKPYCSSDRSAYVALYEEAFPVSERKPFEFMLCPPMSERYELLTVSTESLSVAGLVIIAYTEIGGEMFALLDYLAVSPSLRGQGIGHKILPMVYEHCLVKGAHLFLEIEAPDATADNALQRVRRKQFYLSCGLLSCGVKASMYGTVMELLAYPADAPYISLEVYQGVVRACYPPDMGIPE